MTRRDSEQEADRQRIRERAYAIWEREGRPHGRDRDHWRQAEAEIAEAGETETGTVAAAEPDAGSTITMSPGGRGGRWRHLVESGAAASAGGGRIAPPEEEEPRRGGGSGKTRG